MNKFSLHLFLICFVILNQATFCVLLRVQYLSEIIYSSQFANDTEFQRLLALLVLFISFCLLVTAFNSPKSCIHAHLLSLSTSHLLTYFRQITPSDLTSIGTSRTSQVKVLISWELSNTSSSASDIPHGFQSSL